MSLPTVGMAANNHGHTEGTRVNRQAQQCCMMYDAMTLPISMSICPPLRRYNPRSLNSGIKPSWMKNHGYK